MDKETRAIIDHAVAATLERVRPEVLAYTLKKAAEAVSLPYSTLRDAAYRGEFRTVMRCSKRMVLREELIRWLSDK